MVHLELVKLLLLSSLLTTLTVTIFILTPQTKGELKQLGTKCRELLHRLRSNLSRSTRFILTCNYIERIIDPLQSRCQVLKIVPPSMREVASHIAGILDNENIEWAKETLGPIVKQYYPDIRKILGTAQLSTIDNKLVLDKSILVSNNYIEQVINELKTGKNWKTIRQIIADSNINDYDELFKALYDNVSTYAPQSEGMVTIYINEHSYQANFRIDKEINMMACIAQIIQVL